MPTYIAMLNWDGAGARIDGVRRALQRQSPFLKRQGLHSVTFLPDETGCAAIMVATGACAGDVSRLARAIYPAADVRVDVTCFEGSEDANDQPAALPPPPDRFRRALLEAIGAP